MVDAHKTVVTALKSVLPCHWELQIDSTTETPCITYLERNNSDTVSGGTIGYSDLSYTIKVWAHTVTELQKYGAKVDTAMRKIGFTRGACYEMYDPNSTMKQKIMTFDAMGVEAF